MIRTLSSLPLLLGLFLFAAPGAGADGSQGILEVRIKDHREAIEDFSKLHITTDQILIRSKPGFKFWQSGWKSLAVSPETIDLTKYVGKNSARAFRGGVDPGSFDAIDLKLKEIDGILKKSQRRAQIKDLVGPLKLPFEVRTESETIIILDLVVLDVSDHPPNAYELGVKGYELYTNGKLVDRIPPGS